MAEITDARSTLQTSILGSRLPIWMATVGNVIVAGVIYSLLGWNAAGAHAAARNTARFSLLWFVVGFAEPGLVRFRRLVPASEARLIQAFASAHMVHYSAVLLLGMLSADSMLRQLSAGVIAFVSVGFTLVAVVGLTADTRVASRAYHTVHTLALYVVFLIFFLDYLKHPEHQLRLFAIPLALALMVRWSTRLTLYSARRQS